MIRPPLRLAGLLSLLALYGSLAQELLVANNWGGVTGEVLRYSAAGDWLGSIPSGGASANPVGLTFDTDGNLYVAHRVQGVIHRYASAITEPDLFAHVGLNLPTAMTFNSRGELIVCNYGDGTLSFYSPAGHLLSSVATGLLGPLAVTVDTSDAIYLSVPSVGAESGVFRLNPDGSGRVELISGRDLDARGLAFDRAGNLYVADQRDQTVRRFNPVTLSLEVFASVGLMDPFALAFSPDGELFIANQTSGTVRRYSPEGLDLGNFICLPGTGHNLVGLVFTPVPEPSVAGIVAVLLAWQLRQFARRRA